MKLLSMFLFLLTVCCSPISNAAPDAKPNPEAPSFLTQAQNEYFANNPHVYAYFSELYSKETPPDALAKKYGLSEEVNQKYLKALADNGIIASNYDASGKIILPIKFLVTGTSSFGNDALSYKLSNAMLKEYYEKIVKATETNDDTKQDHYNAMSGFWLTPQEREQLKAEVRALENKYLELSSKNKGNRQAESVSTAFILISDWEPSAFTAVKKDF